MQYKISDTYYGTPDSEASLSHYGVVGMKWGVRRYQNKDGTLTEEGKRRYFVTGDLGFDGGYTLTEAGHKREDKAYAKLYGKKAFKNRYKNLDEQTRKINYELSQKSIKDLERIHKESEDRGRELWQKHIDNIENGKVFTKDYFESKFTNALNTATVDASNVLLYHRKNGLKRARDNDEYDMEYLEMCSDEILDGPKEARLKDYEQYLNDPYSWQNRRYS